MKYEQIKETISKNCRLLPGSTVVAGVSGGPDSLCLLALLHRLGYPVVAAYFDHRLRPDSAQDGELVRDTAERMGAAFISGSADVAAYAVEMHFSIEQAARQLRYRFLFEQARRFSAQAVAVGHTADDQVETILMHLLRGSGRNGLTGMPFRTLLPEWDAEIPLVRPLLGIRRDETLACCHEHKLQPVFDPTNQNPLFFRNRIRHGLIPFLESFNPQFCETLQRTAQILADEAQIIQSAVQEAWDACLVEQGVGYISMDLQVVRVYPVAIQRELIRAAIASIGPAGERDARTASSLQDIEFSVIERAIRWIEAPGSGQVDLSQGLRLFLEEGRLFVTEGGRAPAGANWAQMEADTLDVPIPGMLELGSGWRLVSEWVGMDGWSSFPPQGITHWEAWLDADSLPEKLFIRRARAGDRFQPLGMDGQTVKISDFWINQKLARRARAAWPLVIAGEQVAWVPGFRPAHPFRVQEHTRKVLHLRLVHMD